MLHSYKIEGITCNNCVLSVTKRLSNISGVKGVKFRDKNQTVEVEMDHHIQTSELQKALEGTKYSISEAPHVEPQMRVGQDAPVTIKTYLPVILLLGLILVVTLIIQLVSGKFDPMEWMRHYMAGFFLSFSFFKLLDVTAFANSYSTYDVIAKRWMGYGYIYPFIELALGITFLIPILELPANIVTLIVMSVSIVGVIQSMMRKSTIQCACLGAVFKLPVGKITLLEDALMIVMSATSIVVMYA